MINGIASPLLARNTPGPCRPARTRPAVSASTVPSKDACHAGSILERMAVHRDRFDTAENDREHSTLPPNNGRED